VQQQLAMAQSRPLWLSLATAGILVSGLGYGLHFIYTSYIAPFLEKQKKVDKKMMVLEKAIQDMQENVAVAMKSMQASVDKLESTVTKREMTSTEMETRLKTSQAQVLTELKAEIVSVKGLFLNTRNFPLPASDPPHVQSMHGSTRYVNFEIRPIR
jgi:hypothetical protein